MLLVDNLLKNLSHSSSCSPAKITVLHAELVKSCNPECMFLNSSLAHVKTPSLKMDVAPRDKHWIMRELDGFGLYSMVFVEIQWYSMVFIEI